MPLTVKMIQGKLAINPSTSIDESHAARVKSSVNYPRNGWKVHFVYPIFCISWLVVDCCLIELNEFLSQGHKMNRFYYQERHMTLGVMKKWPFYPFILYLLCNWLNCMRFYFLCWDSTLRDENSKQFRRQETKTAVRIMWDVDGEIKYTINIPQLKQKPSEEL